MPRILGFDPGLTGACVLIDTDRNTLACEPMPTLKVQRNRKWKNTVDEEALALLVIRWDPAVGWIENVFSQGGEGAVGAFSFGEGKGILKGVLAARRVPRRYVSPQRWKGDLNCGNEGILITARCNKLFPNCHRLLKSEGKREAAMITLWGVLNMGLKVGDLHPIGTPDLHTPTPPNLNPS